MQKYVYVFIIFIGLFYLIMPWIRWKDLIEKTWKAQSLTKAFGERAARFIYSFIGLIVIALALFFLFK